MNSLRDRLRFRFDSFMSRGPVSSFVALTVVFTATFIVIAAARAVTTSLINDPQVERGDGTLRQVWLTFVELTDPGSMTQDIDSEPAVKVFTVIAGLLGIVLFSALIAIITTALDRRLANMRKGHSRVVLDQHTVILGWNERIVDVLRELILANESEDAESVVILSDRDKEEMDDYLSLHLPRSQRLTTEIVTRSGAVGELINLTVASVDTARSVILLASASPGSSAAVRDRSDMQVVKTLIGVRQLLVGREVPVVAEIYDAEKRRLASELDREHVVAVDADELLAKILVQTSRSEGLSVVYEEILSFDGAEIYFTEVPTASCFRDLTFSLADGVAIGVARDDGELLINPSADTPVTASDRLLVVASDDSEIAFGQPAPARTFASPEVRRTSVQEHQLIVGWTSKLEVIVREYADYVAAGSGIDIVLRGGSDESPDLAGLAAKVPALNLRLLEIDLRSPSDLLDLDPAQYDSILVLSEAGNAGAAEWADAETLVYLLQLQSLLGGEGTRRRAKIIAEVLDSRNRDLVTEVGIRDFVISNRLISMVMAQISEQREMNDVYHSMFSEDGSEIYLKPLDLYVAGPVHGDVSFADLMAVGFARNETVIGVRRRSHADSAADNFGVHLIPSQDQRFALADVHSLVVFAEDER